MRGYLDKLRNLCAPVKLSLRSMCSRKLRLPAGGLTSSSKLLRLLFRAEASSPLWLRLREGRI